MDADGLYSLACYYYTHRVQVPPEKVVGVGLGGLTTTTISNALATSSLRSY